MAAQPPELPPRDPDPDQRDLSRRSAAPAFGVWLIVGLIVLLGVVVFVVSALTG